MMIHVDCGPGFAAEALAERGERNGVLLPFISKGEPTEQSLVRAARPELSKKLPGLLPARSAGRGPGCRVGMADRIQQEAPARWPGRYGPAGISAKLCVTRRNLLRTDPVGGRDTLHAQMQCICCLRKRQGTSCSKLTRQRENTFESLKNPAHKLESRPWLGITRGSLRRIFVLIPLRASAAAGLTLRQSSAGAMRTGPQKTAGLYVKSRKHLRKPSITDHAKDRRRKDHSAWAVSGASTTLRRLRRVVSDGRPRCACR